MRDPSEVLDGRDLAADLEKMLFEIIDICFSGGHGKELWQLREALLAKYGNHQPKGALDFDLDSILHEHYTDGAEGCWPCDSLVRDDLPCDCGAAEANERIKRLWKAAGYDA